MPDRALTMTLGGADPPARIERLGAALAPATPAARVRPGQDAMGMRRARFAGSAGRCVHDTP